MLLFLLALLIRGVSTPTSMWVSPSDENGIPVRIDVFKAKTGGNRFFPTYTYQLYLPGDAELENCFLSWDGKASAAVNGVSYTSGKCPIPIRGTETACSFKLGWLPLTTYTLVTYQGSADVPCVFIEIDESLGTIASMDNDPDHKMTCSGRISIDDTWYNLPTMKGRGNVSWASSKDKKPYNITLDAKIHFPGVDSKKTEKWSFLAEVNDHSLLSNRVGFHLAYELGIGHDTTSADVWMNGEYQGCYTVTPKIDSFVPKNGFLIEQDNHLEPSVADGGDPQFLLEGLKEADNNSPYNRITVKKMGEGLLLKNGCVDKSAENTEAAADAIRAWLQDAWDAIRSDSGYNSKGLHYSDYIDVGSFAKMYLIQEYVKNYDICAGSIFFHRDGQSSSDKLIAGPIWDLDNAMGATCQCLAIGAADDRITGDRRSGAGEFISLVEENKTSIFKTLSRHEEFMKEVYRQYNNCRSAFERLPDTADQMVSEIAESAKMNHYKVDDISGTYKNLHKYFSETTLGSDRYLQVYLATVDSRTDWANYAANLKTYVSTRSLWFSDHYTSAD